MMDSVNLSELITNIFQGTNISKSNELIIEYSHLKSSWQSSVALLDSPVSYIRFFSANLVYNKIRKDISQLNESERLQVTAFLFELVGKCVHANVDNDTQIYLNRIILSLINISFRVPNGTRTYLTVACQYLALGCSSDNINVSKAGLRMLSPLSDELEAADISSCLRNEIQSFLSESVEQLFVLLDKLCVSPSLSNCSGLVLSVCRAWCSFGMSLTKLFKSFNTTFQLLNRVLMSANLTDVMEGWSLVGELVTVTEYPRETIRDEIIVSLLQMMISSSSKVILSDANVSTSLCNALVTISTAELPRFVSADPTLNPFFSLLISVIQLRPRRLLMLTFDMWIELQDTPFDEIHPLVKSEVLSSLLRVILNHITFTTDVIGEDCDEEEQEDWIQLRDPRLGLGEVLTVCQFGMRSQLFHTLFQLLPSAGSLSSIASLAQFEAVVYLVSIFESLKSTLDSKGLNGLIDVSLLVSFVHELVCRCLILLSPENLQQLTATVTCEMLTVVKVTVFKFFGSITFLLTKSTSQYLGFEIKRGESVLNFADLFLPSVQLLLSHIPSSESKVAQTAGKSVHQLCIHGIKWLTAVNGPMDGPTVTAFPSLHAMLALYGQYVKASVNQEALVILTESLVRCVVAVPSTAAAAAATHQQTLLSLMYEPIIVSLMVECSSDTFVAKKLLSLLALISQVIRFCDVPVQNNTHILMPALQQLWPLLELIGNTPLTGEASDCTAVLSSIFEIFGRVFSSFGVLAMSQCDQVAHLIVNVLRSCSSCSSAALKCASVLVELFVTKLNNEANSSASVSFLSALLSNIVEVYSDAFTVCSQRLSNDPLKAVLLAFNNDLDCIQDFFSFLYGYLIFCPSIVSTNSHIIPIFLELSLYCLESCSERDPLKSVLQLLQCGFCPPALNSNPTLQRNISDQFLAYGDRTVSVLLHQLSRGALLLSLAPITSDVLLSVIAGCPEAQLSVCQSWFHATIVTDSQYFSRLESCENRKLLFNLLFHFARVNTRRFKVLIQDLFKICSSELNVDALLAYSDVLVG